MGRDTEYPLDANCEANLAELLIRLNKFRNIYGKPMRVSSGYRPGKYNTAAGGAKNSAHLTCEACDFHDPDRSLTGYILGHPEILINCNLYMEEPSRTPTWVHLQIRATKSGSRIFKP